MVVKKPVSTLRKLVVPAAKRLAIKIAALEKKLKQAVKDTAKRISTLNADHKKK